MHASQVLWHTAGTHGCLKVMFAMHQCLQGRDMNQRLQRANKAKVMKEHLPARVDKLQKQLEAWQLTEGGPFLYDGSDYMVRDTSTPYL